MQAAARPSRQIPDQERVDVAEQNIAGLSALANAPDIVQNPADLQATEIGCQRQPGFSAEAIGTAVARELRNIMIDARVLPNERVINRVAGLPIPNHGCFALIRDADCREIAGAQSPLLQGLHDDFFVRRQISEASCSTHPGCGKICSCSFCAADTMRPDRSNTMNRVLVVP